MNKLNERLEYLVSKDLVPNALYFLESQKIKDNTICSRGILLEGRKHFRRVKKLFEQNEMFFEKGLQVRSANQGLRNFFFRLEISPEFKKGEWYRVNLDEYFKIYLMPGSNPPITGLLESKYD